MIDFGVTQAQIDLLGTTITAFRASLGAPRQAIVGSATATAQIAASMAVIDALLTKLDNLTEVLRPAHPAFYTGYHSARQIIDLGGVGSPPPEPEPPQA